MGLIKDIFFWLFIFVVGSLIVNWIFYGGLRDISNSIGNSIQSFKDKEDEASLDNQIPDNLIEIETGGDCNSIDKISDAGKVSRSEVRKGVCNNICYWNGNGTSAQFVQCVNDKLICYCQK